MSEIQGFIADNLLLVIVLGCLIMGYVIFEVFMRKSSGEIVEVSPQKAVDLLNHQNALLLDIRALADFNTSHCMGSVSIHNYTTKLDQFKNKPVVVICNSGRTSVVYAKELTAKGFAQALSLAGGIIGWKNADFPLAIVN